MKWLKEKTSSRRKPGSIHQPAQTLKWTPACAGVTVLIFLIFLICAPDSFAEDVTYGPESCEFSIVFPGAPYTAQRCNPADPEKCDPITSYTKVFGMDATVNFNVTCIPVSADMYSRYSGDVMRTTLEAMVGRQHLDQYKTSFQQHDDKAKQAILLGAGRTGKSDKIYTAQLWIGHRSVFTVEGELIGVPLDEADDMFAAILRSIGHKDGKQESEPKQEEQDDNKTDEESD